MPEEFAIKVDTLSKDFSLPHLRKSSVKSVFTGVFDKNSRSRTTETQHALKDITFEIKKGEFFGIVGRNGSGKSTLLKILAGIYQPTKGNVYVSGNLVPFIELGVGFNPELTGRENVYLNGALLGFSRSKIDAMYDDIVDFAELSKFMDQKLKNYSSGMQVRLAFSMAIRADADILLVDEVLAVGDADFQRKCFDYFRELKRLKKTVVFVSHDMSAVREYCDRAILIESSKLVDSGSADQVATEYTKLFNDSASQKGSSNHRWGDKKVVFSNFQVKPEPLHRKDKHLTISAKFSSSQEVINPIFGIIVKSQTGQQLFGTNTKIKNKSGIELHPDTRGEILWEIPNLFNDGVYSFDIAITDSDGVTQHDWWEDAGSIRVYNEEKTPFSMNPNINTKLVINNEKND